MIGFLAAAKTRGAEEDDCVLNLLAAKSRERLEEFGDDTDQASIGAVEEFQILIRERGRLQDRRRSIAGNDRARYGCGLGSCSGGLLRSLDVLLPCSLDLLFRVFHRSTIPVTNGFFKSKQYVQEPDSGNDASDCAVRGNRGERGKHSPQWIVVPQAIRPGEIGEYLPGPRHITDERSQVNPQHDAKIQLGAYEPAGDVRRLGFGVRRRS